MSAANVRKLVLDNHGNWIDAKCVNREMAKSYVGNSIYKALIGIIESYEHAGLIDGNGYHFVQKIIAEVQEEIEKRWRCEYDSRNQSEINR